MKRAPYRQVQFERTDTVVVFALAAIGLSYALGNGLNWSEAEAAAPEPAAAVLRLAASAELGAANAGPVLARTPFLAAPHAPVAEPADPSWNELVRRLAAEAIGFGGRAAIYIKDMQNGRIWAYHADDLFPSASLIKVPIMMATFEKIGSGKLSLQTRLRLERRHRTGGSGSLKWYRDGAQFTVRQLLEKMIDESDNTATKMVIDQVGLAYLQEHFPKMGLLYTEIYPEGLSLRSSGVTYENYTTAREMAALLERMYAGQAVDRYSSQLMLDIMKRQKTRARLAKFLPAGWEIAHKTGLLRRACHDSAVIFTPKGDYLMVVLTGQNQNYGQAKDFITRLGRLTYRYYQGDPSFLARTAEYRLARRQPHRDDVN